MSTRKTALREGGKHTGARRTAALLLALLLLCGLAGCGNGAADADGKKEGQLRIVATIFPEYDWVKNLLGENPGGATVTLLLDSGTDMHSFQPTAEDMMTIASCDLFIYVGGESDSWVRDALRNAGNPGRIAVDLLSVLGDAAKEEVLLEGMQEEAEENGADEAEDGHDDATDHGHGSADSHVTGYDEHVWLSLRNAQACCRAITDALIRLDPENKAYYEETLASYMEKLDTLDKAYTDAVGRAGRKTLLFGDRFPFRYLADDYGLTCYAAFSGCSAETEASFETVIFLAEKTDTLSLPCVLVIDGSDERIARTIIENTAAKNQKVLTLDSMQSVTGKEIDAGETYLGIMEKNLGVLKEALN